MGKPVPWARPGRSKFNKCYDTQKDEKESYRWSLKVDHGASPLFSGPLGLDVIFYMPMTGTIKKLSSEKPGLPHYSRPDVDNFAKFFIDAATGVLYQDDCIIADLRARKIYDENPRTMITIWEL